jgi:hypothetical protein
MNKYGKDLSFKEHKLVESKGILDKGKQYETVETKFYKPDTYIGNYLNFKINYDAPRINLHPASIASLEKLKCTACGSDYRVEMHHVRKMKPHNIGVPQNHPKGGS